MADTQADQLSALRHELERLEGILMLDPNWRALRQFDQRAADGRPLPADDGNRLRHALKRSLSANHAYTSRRDILQRIAHLQGHSAPTPPQHQPSQDAAPQFRTRLKLKQKLSPEAVAPPQPQPADRTNRAGAAPITPAAPSRPDRFDLIDGISPSAAAALHAAGITAYRQISTWSAADAIHWHHHLRHCARGPAIAWIEQATVLASGRLTHHAARIMRGEFDAVVPRPLSEPARAIAEPQNKPAAPSPSPATAAPMPAPDTVAIDIGATAAGDDFFAATPGAQIEIVTPEALSSLRPRQRAATERPKTTEPLPHASVAPEVRAKPEQPLADTTDAPAEFRASQDPAPSPPPPETHAPHSLLQRLRNVKQPERPRLGTYAAYRGTVEEASVKIIRPGQDPATDDPPPEPAGNPSRPVGGLIKALTGKS